MLAGSTIILNIDRPLRLPVRHRVPGHPVGSRVALLINLIAIVLTLGVATYGLMGDRRNVALAGIVASLLIAIAMVARARDSLRTAEHAAELLDGAVLESERARDELRAANAQLRKTNADQLVTHLAVAQAFDLIDERTEGRLRELVEQAGGDLAALVEESLG
jgi:hypothetical protein